MSDSKPSEKKPKHLAIIMDGNGRWAQNNKLSRSKGHKKGVETASKVTELCIKNNIHSLTLFAFGQENWERPTREVRYLFRLFLLSLKKQVHWLNNNHIKLKIIGDKSTLPASLSQAILDAEQLTQHNSRLQLNIACNYSGQWDIAQAVKQWVQNAQVGNWQDYLSLSSQDNPDLFIRTSGVYRLSNFILWEMAYTELYFTPVMWPEFSEKEFDSALQFFNKTERRFGKTSLQVMQQEAGIPC
jgi:undecaprenyl diphosphate synthase